MRKNTFLKIFKDSNNIKAETPHGVTSPKRLLVTANNFWNIKECGK